MLMFVPTGGITVPFIYIQSECGTLTNRSFLTVGPQTAFCQNLLVMMIQTPHIGDNGWVHTGTMAGIGGVPSLTHIMKSG
jgi:hypothetical protein